MRGEPSAPAAIGNECGAHRIGIAARPRVTKGGDVIDIDSKTQRRTCNMIGSRQTLQRTSPHPEERPLGRVSKDERCVFMVQDARKRRAPHMRESYLPIDALDPCDDGLWRVAGDNSAEMLQVIDLKIDGQFGEILRAPEHADVSILPSCSAITVATWARLPGSLTLSMRIRAGKRCGVESSTSQRTSSSAPGSSSKSFSAGDWIG